MAHIKTIVEASWTPDDENDPGYGKFYLLHWGLKYDIFPDENGVIHPAQITVGICQEISTGNILLFLPTSLKVIGYERIDNTDKNGKDKDESGSTEANS